MKSLGEQLAARFRKLGHEEQARNAECMTNEEVERFVVAEIKSAIAICPNRPAARELANVLFPGATPKEIEEMLVEHPEYLALKELQ